MESILTGLLVKYMMKIQTFVMNLRVNMYPVKPSTGFLISAFLKILYGPYHCLKLNWKKFSNDFFWSFSNLLQMNISQLSTYEIRLVVVAVAKASPNNSDIPDPWSCMDFLIMFSWSKLGASCNKAIFSTCRFEIFPPFFQCGIGAELSNLRRCLDASVR